MAAQPRSMGKHKGPFEKGANANPWTKGGTSRLSLPQPGCVTARFDQAVGTPSIHESN